MTSAGVSRAPVWSRLRPYLLLVLLSAALFMPGQAGLPPFDRDESRYLQATAQMFETGDFVDIRFQDQPRYLQPAGIYWLQAASVALFDRAADFLSLRISGGERHTAPVCRAQAEQHRLGVEPKVVAGKVGAGEHESDTGTGVAGEIERVGERAAAIGLVRHRPEVAAPDEPDSHREHEARLVCSLLGRKRPSQEDRTQGREHQPELHQVLASEWCSTIRQ